MCFFDVFLFFVAFSFECLGVWFFLPVVFICVGVDDVLLLF